MVRRQSELDQNTPDHHTLGLPKLVITASIFHGADCGLERHLHEPRKAAKLERKLRKIEKKQLKHLKKIEKESRGE